MSKENNLLNVFLIIAFIVLLFYILNIWANLIIPFIIALLFSFAIIWLSDFYKNIKINTYRLPWFITMLLSLWTYVFVFWLLWKMINANIQDVIKLLPEYQQRLNTIYIWILEYFNVPDTVDIYSLFNTINFTSIATSTIASITTLFSQAGLILFYVIFILLEYRFFWDKINKIFTWKAKWGLDALKKIKNDIRWYFVIKTIVSFTTATLSYLIMAVVWLDFAMFWAFLVFALNFIPSIWSIIAVFFPITLSLVQFDSYLPFLFLAPTLIWIQMLMWNIIEPRFMGNKLNLSPLVIILSLWFWGSIWGVIWMLLAVPLMVIINIILSKFETTRPIAVLLSQKWELDVSDDVITKANKKDLLDTVRKRIEVLKKIKK